MTVIDQPSATAVIARLRATRLPPAAERRRLRLAAGATLQDVAEALKVSIPTVSCWERDIYMPSPRFRVHYLALLAEFAAIEREKAALK
ncbi:MAG: helix-turn-helix transcriptional regulator [Actinoplanes sp.]